MNLSPRAAHSVLTALRRNGKSILLEELAEIGADEEVLERLLTRLKRAAAQDLELGYPYAFLLSWLVARVGPRLSASYEMLEAEVGKATKASDALVMPRWTLAMPMDGALQRRMPCSPLVEGEDEELARAYRGLVDHLAFVAALPEGNRRLEMLNTAIPWRVVALADRLEEGTEPIATRLQRLKGRTVGGGRTPRLEMDWWRSLDGDLCLRRHALSHLGETDGGWTFSKCVDAMWTLDEAREATAGIALAVLDRVRWYLHDIPPNAQMLDDVLTDGTTAWLDEFGED